MNGQHVVVDDRRDRLQFGEQLEARLRLARLGGLGAETVDEGLQLLAAVLLLLAGLGGERARLAPLRLERAEIALVERQLAALEMQNMGGDGVEQIAIMADDEDAGRIAREIIDQPERALEIEVIGRLVEQQQLGLGEQHGGQRHAHAPAAREFRERPLLRRGVEAEAGKDRAGARRRGMGFYVDEAGVDLGDLVRIGLDRLALEQSGALDIGGEHEIDERGRAARRLLLDASELQPRGQRDGSALRGDLAADEPEQGRLAGAIAADEAGARPRRQEHAGLVEQDARAEPIGEIVDREHERPCRPFRVRGQSSRRRDEANSEPEGSRSETRTGPRAFRLASNAVSSFVVRLSPILTANLGAPSSSSASCTSVRMKSSSSPSRL